MMVARVALVVMFCACSVELARVWMDSQGRTVNYVVSDKPLMWKDAWDHCELMGGHLLILETKEEADFVRSLMEFYGLNETHVGLHGFFQNGKYRTIFGVPMRDTAFKWAENEPHMGVQYCVALHKDMTIFDIICDLRFHYICEKEF